MKDKRITSIAKVSLVLYNVGLFALVWISYYNDLAWRTHKLRGIFISIAAFYILYHWLAKLYRGYAIASSPVEETVLSQFISFGIADLISYIAAVLLHRDYVNILPGAFIVVCQLVGTTLIVWASKRYILSHVQPSSTLLVCGAGVQAQLKQFRRQMEDKLAHLFSLDHVVSEDAPRGLGGETITREQAVARAAEFVGTEHQNAVFSQESGGSIPAYDVQVTLPDTVLHLAVTRQGGQVLWMFPETAGFTARYGLEECKQAAQRFFSAHGYGEMELTFWQMYGGMATLSYAAVQDGVLLYPDLIKIQLRLDTLAVVGLEARHYLSSHTRRGNLTPAVSRSQAQAAVSERLTVTGARLCVIPLNAREYLCWQFTGAYNGQTYYVYIDAQTGAQRDIQRLVVSSEGPKAE